MNVLFFSDIQQTDPNTVRDNLSVEWLLRTLSARQCDPKSQERKQTWGASFFLGACVRLRCRKGNPGHQVEEWIELWGLRQLEVEGPVLEKKEECRKGALGVCQAFVRTDTLGSGTDFSG